MKKIQEINAAKPETWTVLNKLQQKFRISITPEHDKDGSQVKQFFLRNMYTINYDYFAR